MQLCNVGSRVNHTKQRGTRHATMLEGKANLTTTSRCINTNISYLEHLFEQCIIIIIIIMIDPPSYLFVHAECTQCQLSSYTCNVIFAAKYYIFGSSPSQNSSFSFPGFNRVQNLPNAPTILQFPLGNTNVVDYYYIKSNADHRTPYLKWFSYY